MNSPLPQAPVERPDSATAFYVRNEGLLIKGAPLLIGFLIFFLYFAENSFFPSTDLFGLASLMLSAFIVGAGILAIAVLGLWLPTWMWTTTILGDSSIWQKLNSGKKANVGDQHVALGLIIAYFVFPCLLTSIAWIAAIYLFFSGISSTFTLALFLLVGTATATIIARTYKISWRKLPSLIAGVGVPIGLYGLIAAVVTLQLYKHVATSGTQLELACALAISCAFTWMVVSAYAITHKMHWKLSLSLKLFFALVIAIPSNMYREVPDFIVNLLGAGNYEATSLLLSDSQCKTLTNKYPDIEKCTLDNVHVIWGLGDTLKIRVALHNFISGDFLTYPCTARTGCLNDLTIAKDGVTSIVR